MEVDVLVGVCGLAIDVEVERAVRIANDGDIKHSNSSILLNFFGPLYVGVNGIEVIVEWLNVVVVNGGDGVVGFSENCSPPRSTLFPCSSILTQSLLIQPSLSLSSLFA